jgi:hypothetical protein
MQHPYGMESSIEVVKTIVGHIFSDYKFIHRYGVKKVHGSYEVWMTQKGQTITVQTLSREIILPCTDPDEATALKFQSFIERCIRQGLKVLTPDVS